MSRKLKLFFLFALIAGAFSSCKGNKVLTVTPESVLISPEGIGQYVTVDAPGDWTVTSSAAWVKLGVTSGSGSGTVYVYADKSTEARAAVLTFESMGQKTMVAVTQGEGGGEQGGGGQGEGGGGSGGGGTAYVDVLNVSFTGGAEVNQYNDWSGKNGSSSSAVYAGNSAGGSKGNACIQLRSKNNNSGIVSTTSGGRLSKINLVWNAQSGEVGNTAARVVQVYGSTTAYSSPADLYTSGKQGTLVGELTYGKDTELTVSGNYTYVGLRSKENALYLDEIKITWTK